MNKTANKKDLFYYIILILTLIAVIVGATFAIYTFLHKQEEGSSAIYTGTLAIEYLSGNIIKCNNLYPTNSPDYIETENVYKNNFKVTNLGTLDSLLTINLDINTNEFSDKFLMYTLYNEEGETLIEGQIVKKDNQILIDNLSLEHETTADFTLMIWLKENGENQNEEMKKTLTATIKVDANQIVE